MNGTSPDDEAAKAKKALEHSQKHYLRGLHLWDDVFRIIGAEGKYIEEYKRVYDVKDEGDNRGNGRHRKD